MGPESAYQVGIVLGPAGGPQYEERTLWRLGGFQKAPFYPGPIAFVDPQN